MQFRRMSALLKYKPAAHQVGMLGSVPLLLLLAGACCGATFTNNASVQITDPTSSLTATGATFTASCWFRISIPSGQTVSDNMDILMDRTDGNESAAYSYLIRYNFINNAVEFATGGSSGGSATPITLIQNPFIERWYHVAIARSGSSFYPYVDGRWVAVPQGWSPPLGSTTGSGVSIGGINGNSKQFAGDIIEVAIYSSALSQSQIQSRMFQDQRIFQNLRGYYKLAFSTNAADFYRNFAPAPPAVTGPAVPVGSGTIAFPEVDQAGEQSLFDANLNHGQNALTPLSGAFAWAQTVLSRPVPGIAFDLEIGYSSALPTQPPTDGSPDPYDQRILGGDWRETFDARVVYGPANNLDELDVINWDGSLQAWSRSSFTGVLATRDHQYQGELVQSINTQDVQWTTPARLVYLFHDPGDETNPPMAGRLVQISDFNGNVVHVQWDWNEGFITNVVDSVGGNYQFNYDSNRQLLTNVTFGAWQANFTYDSTNRLISKSLTNTAGIYAVAPATWQFQYGPDGLLAQVIDPRGNTNLLVQYDQYGRQTNQVDALARATGTEYDEPQTWQMRHTDPADFQWVETYDRGGHVLAQQDPLGNVTSYSYDTNGNRIRITEPLGWTTIFGYDDRANVISRTNALGEVTRWAFHGFFNKATNEVDAAGWTNNYILDDATGNLLGHYDALGTLVAYTYSTNGLVLASADANGNTTTLAYDTNGFLAARTDPATNTTMYAHNDVGWKLAETNALGQATTYRFDLDGNVVRTTDPLDRTFTKTYDGNGNLLTASDGKGQLTTYGYDAANQRITMTNRAGYAWTYAYTSRGALQSVVDPLGDTVTRTYDAANRLIAVTDPMGNSVTNVYDANGNQTVLIDQLGQAWPKTYDRLDRVVTQADPRGNSTRTTYDPVGRVSTITTPNGYPTAHFYDGRGRLIKWVDAQNFPWQYAYDGVGNITNITDALGGHYTMAYGSRNERLLERNQDSNVWRYAYDPLLRLASRTDPKGITRTMAYDPGGRVIEVDYNTGRVDGYVYDDNNNPVTLSRSGSGPATLGDLTYDVMDRVLSDSETFGNTIGYSYDALGRRHTLTYPDGKTLAYFYDPINRLTSQVDWAGRQMIYAYDKAGRLIQRTYPNSIVQSNAFDNAGRITSLSYAAVTSRLTTNRAVHIALTYAYDRNGNKVGSTEQGTLAWPMPPLRNETTAYTPAGKLIAKTDALTDSNNFAYQYGPSGNMTNAASPAQSYALTYDEDNRTTSIHWTVGLSTNEIITNRYDVLGRRIAKTVSGDDTEYVLDLGGGMERILCDTDANGQITAWYVHGPDLCYKVDATNGLTCYHADGMANVIATTDGTTNLISEYAYTPYGRALGSTNAQGQIPNPYLFVGSEGAMEELPGLYFMRARYYWADPGVFLSADPVRHVGPGWLPTAYSYAGNNPFNYVDPRGLSESDLQLWGAFGIGGYADIEWSSSVLPTIQVGIGGGLGAGASYTYSTGEPDTTGGNRSIIAVAAAGPISGQGTLTWKQGQSVFSGSQSAAAQVGEGPVSFGGTISGNGVSLQQSYGLGIGGAGFYTQPLSAWQTGFERASAAAWNLMFPGWEPALAQGSTKTKLPYDETIAPPLQPVSVSRQANSCATGVSTHGAVLNNLQSSTPALPSIQSGATASPFTSASVITGGPAFNFAVNLLASQNQNSITTQVNNAPNSSQTGIAQQVVSDLTQAANQLGTFFNSLVGGRHH